MQLEQGQIVTVRLYGGKTAPRRVVADKTNVVVVCSEEEYQAALREHRKPEGIGFPRQDVVGIVTNTGEAVPDQAIA